ncbi:Chlorophyllase OS=Streptomyces griseorubiginosus OX=67304 GN=AQJ54_39545 PE=4 SV=1 [Streptomyces griseorubiginosus]
MSTAPLGRSDSAVPVVSVRPITLSAPDRGDDLRVRVTAPATGHHLPVVVFSHGMTLGMDATTAGRLLGAAHGFVVIQPTHLDYWACPPTTPATR